MARTDASAAVSVERFFQFSLLGLVASGYLAVAGSGYLDVPTMALTAAGLMLRGLLIYGALRVEISERAATLATIAYSGFYVLDYLFLSRSFLWSSVHLVFFLAVVKILTAKTNRDHLYTAIIAFLELIAAAILSNNFNFFLFLTLYLVFGIAALTSGEIRRSMAKASSTARTGLRRFHPRLAMLAFSITAGILILTAGLFFILPRTADAAFSRLISHRMHLPGFSNQVNLGEIGEIKTSSRPVMHIRVYGEFPAGLKWRGESLTDFDGKRWYNPNRERRPVEVIHGEAELVPPADRSPGRRLNYEVQYDDLDTDALFFAGTPDTVVLHSPRLYRTEAAASGSVNHRRRDSTTTLTACSKSVPRGLSRFTRCRCCRWRRGSATCNCRRSIRAFPCWRAGSRRGARRTWDARARLRRACAPNTGILSNFPIASWQTRWRSSYLRGARAIASTSLRP